MDILKHTVTRSFQHPIAQCSIGSVVLVLLTVLYFRLHFNLATAVLLYVIVITLLARTGGLVSSIFVSLVAAVCLMYLVPPSDSFLVNDPLDVVAIAGFLLVSLTIALLVTSLRKMKEEALSSVDRRLIDAEQRERARIGRDLHDNIGQRVALLAINCERLRSDVPDVTAERRTTVDELLKQIDELSTDIHDLAYALHSPRIEQLGLVKTMRGFCRDFARQQKVEIDFRSDDLRRQPSLDVSQSLFRVLQEALQNSVKHSGARQFEVELLEASDAIHRSVRDSGLGFDSEAARKGSGLGLISMQERMKLVKGELSIDSQLNRGTTIHARVPLRSGNHSARAGA